MLYECQNDSSWWNISTVVEEKEEKKRGDDRGKKINNLLNVFNFLFSFAARTVIDLMTRWIRLFLFQLLLKSIALNLVH